MLQKLCNLRRNRQRIRKTPLKSTISEGFWSEWRGSNSRPRGPKPRVLSAELHPDIHFSAMIPRRGVKIKIFLSVVIYVVKAAFMPLSAIGENPVNAGAARLCSVSPCPIPDTATALPNQARYQLRYTRIFTFLHDTTARGKNKVFSVCGHSCGQRRFCAAFCNRGKSRKCRRRKALRRFTLPRPGYRHGTPKCGTVPTPPYPDRGGGTPPDHGRRTLTISDFLRSCKGEISRSERPSEPPHGR